jgi:Fe-S-cluster containining protein
MNRTLRKRIQRLLESKPIPSQRGAGGQQLAIDALWEKQYRRTLEQLGAATAETAGETATALSRGLLECTEEAHRLGQEWDEESRAGSACKAGCNWCCHEPLQVSPLDAVAVAAADLSTPLDYALDSRERTQLKRIFKPCPMLVDGHCSVYAHRPVICRAYHSTNVGRCQEIVQLEMLQRSVPMHVKLYGFTGLAQEATFKALDDVGIDRRPVVLGLAVAALRRDFDGMARSWLSGGAAFQEVTVL